MELILASNSPRRREILSKMGYSFTVIPSFFEEEGVNFPPLQMAKELAFFKAKEVFDRLNKTDIVVLGADTTVCLDEKILGKPKDREDAFSMLSALSGKTHEVITGYAIITKDKTYRGAIISEVTFNELSDSFINEYLDNAKPFDKAGSYGIQDGYDLVKNLKGSFDNVVGLPSEKLGEILKEIFIK